MFPLAQCMPNNAHSKFVRKVAASISDNQMALGYFECTMYGSPFEIEVGKVMTIFSFFDITINTKDKDKRVTQQLIKIKT